MTDWAAFADTVITEAETRRGGREEVAIPGPHRTRGTQDGSGTVGGGQHPPDTGIFLHVEDTSDGAWLHVSGVGDPVSTRDVRAAETAIVDRLGELGLAALSFEWHPFQLALRALPSELDHGASGVLPRPPLSVLRLPTGKPNYRDGREAERYLAESGWLAWSLGGQRALVGQKPDWWAEGRPWPEPWETWIARTDPSRVAPAEQIVEDMKPKRKPWNRTFSPRGRQHEHV